MVVANIHLECIAVRVDGGWAGNVGVAVQHNLQTHVKTHLPLHNSSLDIPGNISLDSFLILELPDQLGIDCLCERGVEVEGTTNANISWNSLEHSLLGLIYQ